jgi:hypothetical protein
VRVWEPALALGLGPVQERVWVRASVSVSVSVQAQE